ncbi:hypothetical protein ACB098_02G147800 [Castanea mollissima]
MGLVALQAAQVLEHEPLDTHGEQLVRLYKYFAFKTFSHGMFSPEEKFQSSLARRAKFLGQAVWMPNPPWSIGRVTVSQFTMCIFLFLEVEPQRKLRLAQSISWQTLLGSKAPCIT